MMSETIAAISTAPGEGAIGIVRISGPESENIMRRMMKDCPVDIKTRHAYFREVVKDNSLDDAEPIDEAVFILMKEPGSYTGEDMLEIQGHGSNFALKNILSAVLDDASGNVRMAEPGEFTKLAFLNGKMDLSQAEAVMDIIRARSDISLEIAESQRAGRLSDSVEEIRSDLMEVLAQMAVSIDFPEEDEENIGDSEDYGELINSIRWIKNDIRSLVNTSSIGRIAREGIKVAIVGKPNAGKSSLMNAILGEGRMIVTDIPGTTRDTVEENATMGGIPVVLIDTAGLRDTDDKVEKIGIDRTVQAAASSDIVLLVIDGSSDLDEEDEMVIDTLKNMDPDHVIVVINKEDLGINVNGDRIKEIFPDNEIITTSLIGKAAVDAASRISETIVDVLELREIDVRESSIVTNQRHIKLLKNAYHNLNESMNLLLDEEPVEVAELSAHYAYEELGRIIGEEVGDEVLDTVFSKFCLGK